MDPSNKSSGQLGSVTYSRDKNGIIQVLLRNNCGCSAQVSLFGGQVMSWKTARGEELLFTSKEAIFKPPAPARGGIPIFFPLFPNRELLETHGFARKRIWDIEETPPTLSERDLTTQPFVDLLLKPADIDIINWPHRFHLRLRVILKESGSLRMITRIRNMDSKPFSFFIAFHTYFSISNIEDVRVEGLQFVDYFDNLLEKERFTQGDDLTFDSEVDRVYISVRENVLIRDHQKRRTFVIEREGLPDVLVWNPWEKKSKALKDFGNKEYVNMLCVDGAAMEKTITLKPDEEWTGRLQLSVMNGS